MIFDYFRKRREKREAEAIAAENARIAYEAERLRKKYVPLHPQAQLRANNVTLSNYTSNHYVNEDTYDNSASDMLNTMATIAIIDSMSTPTYDSGGGGYAGTSYDSSSSCSYDSSSSSSYDSSSSCSYDSGSSSYDSSSSFDSSSY